MIRNIILRSLVFLCLVVSPSAIDGQEYTDSCIRLLDLPDSQLFARADHHLSLAKEGISLMEATGNDDMKLKYLLIMARLLESQGDPEGALEAVESCIDKAEEQQNMEIHARALALNAKCLKEQGHYLMAVENLEAAANEFAMLQDTLRWIEMLYDAGLIYRWHIDPVRALSPYKQALQLAESSQNSYYPVYLHATLGCAYNGSARYVSARIELAKSLRMCNSPALHGLRLNVLISLAMANLELGDPDEAAGSADEALELADMLDNVPKYIELLNLKSEILIQLGNYAEARVWAEKARRHARERSLRPAELRALRNLVDISHAQGRTSAAKTYFDSYNNLMIMHREETVSGEIERMKKQFDHQNRLREKQMELDTLAQKNEIQQLRLRKTYLLISLMAIILLATALITLLMINRSKLRTRMLRAEHDRALLQKQKLELELGNRTRELSTTATHIAQKNRMLTAMEDQISQLKAARKVNGELDGLHREIRKNIDADRDWETMKLHFEKVYPDFFSLLTSRFPHLTPLDLKHCAYLRMRLSNKELARMLNIEPNSVKTLRYRLKKKLELPVGEDLFNFVEHLEEAFQ